MPRFDEQTPPLRTPSHLRPLLARASRFSLLAALASSAAPALAAPPEVLRLKSSSTCPSVAEVRRELGPLLPRTRVEANARSEDSEPAADGEERIEATIADEGESIRVEVAREQRVLRDPQRSCSERARAVAVFIALVLDPPVLSFEPKPRPPAPPPAPPAPTSPVKEGAPLTLELGPVLEMAPLSDAAQLPIAGGFGGRLAWGRGVAASFGAGLLLPTRLQLPEADARLVWLPFDVSLRVSHPIGAVRLAAELGPELALLFASGEAVKNPRTSTRLEVGARLAGSLTWDMSTHLGAFLTVFSLWRPQPYEFRVEPDLESGTTPPLWLGASLGLSLSTR
jgi:hypothetical protein